MRARLAIQVVALALAYAALARLSLALAVVHPSASAVWPPSGLAIGALAILGTRLAPGVFIGALTANWWASGDPWTSLAIALGNTAEAVIAGHLVRRFAGGIEAFGQANLLGRFILFCAVAPLASSLVGPTALAIAGTLPWNAWHTVWATWHLGDLTGALLVAPPTMLLLRPAAYPRRTAWPEQTAILTAAGAVALLISPLGAAIVGLEVVAILPIIWAANRAGPRTTSLLVLALAAVVTIGAAFQARSLGSTPDNLALMTSQVRMGILTVLGLFVAAVVQQRESALTQAGQALLGLEDEVRRRTEALTTSEAQLRHAHQLARVGRWEFRGQTVHLNDVLQDMLGSPAIIEERALGDHMPASQIQDLRDLAAAKPDRLDVRVQVRSRTRLFHLHVIGTPTADGWEGTAQDVTDAAEREEVLDRLKSMVESSPTAIIQTDLSLRVTDLNPAAERLLRTRRSAARGYGLAGRLNPKDRERVTRALHDVVEGATIREMPARLKRGSKSVDVALTMAGFHDPEGRLAGVVVQVRDMRTEMEARRIQEEVLALDKVNQFKTEFINTASHELRTPLTPIRIQLQILHKRGKLSEEDARSIGIIERNMRRLSDLVDDVFAAAKLQSGDMPFEPIDTDVDTLIQETAEVFKPQCEEREISLQAHSTVGHTLPADPARITQVLTNLLSNAIKFTPAGGTIEIHGHSDGAHAIIEVVDSGPGVPEDKANQLFQPFSQAHGAGGPDGTGLGLYISHGIVALHGGTIRLAHKKEGEGARFVVTLPLRQRPKRPERPQMNQPQVPTPPVGSSPS